MSLIKRKILHAYKLSHVIEFTSAFDEVLHRSKGIRIDPEDGKTYSQWEREERKKPPPKKEGAEEEEQ